MTYNDLEIADSLEYNDHTLPPKAGTLRSLLIETRTRTLN